MSLREIEFELTPVQYERMRYPGLRQGQPVSMILDGGVVLPDRSVHTWFTVQQEPITPRMMRTGPAQYAVSGPIIQADIARLDDRQVATLIVDCDGTPVRVTCEPGDDGLLPFGTWETRFFTGFVLLEGIAEDDFAVPLGEPVGLTIWHFSRLALHPGDPHFGEWLVTDSLPPLPFSHDRIIVTARQHRQWPSR